MTEESMRDSEGAGVACKMGYTREREKNPSSWLDIPP